MKAKLGRFLGIFSLFVCGIVLVISLFGLSPGFHLGLDGSIIIIMLGVCSYGLLIAAELIEKDHPSATKIFPSCIVAYGLVLVIFHYWFQRLA